MAETSDTHTHTRARWYLPALSVLRLLIFTTHHNLLSFIRVVVPSLVLANVKR